MNLRLISALALLSGFLLISCKPEPAIPKSEPPVEKVAKDEDMIGLPLEKAEKLAAERKLAHRTPSDPGPSAGREPKG